MKVSITNQDKINTCDENVKQISESFNDFIVLHQEGKKIYLHKDYIKVMVVEDEQPK